MPSSRSLPRRGVVCPAGCVLLAATFLLAFPAVATSQTPSAVRVLRAAAVLADPQGAAAVVATVNPGELLEVLDERNGWYLVRPRAGGTWMAGWINGANVEVVSAEVITAPPPAPPSTQAQRPASRKGFIIGLGGGGAWYREPSFLGPNYTSAIVTDFSIGYAPTSQVLIYYNNQVGWIGSADANANVVGVTGVGVTYMLRPTSRSAFVRGSVGGGIIADVDFDSSTIESDDAGLGLTVSGGYEFARHWSVEGGAMFVRPPDASTHTLFKVTVNWMFY